MRYDHPPNQISTTTRRQTTPHALTSMPHHPPFDLNAFSKVSADSFAVISASASGLGSELRLRIGHRFVGDSVSGSSTIFFGCFAQLHVSSTLDNRSSDTGSRRSPFKFNEGTGGCCGRCWPCGVSLDWRSAPLPVVGADASTCSLLVEGLWFAVVLALCVVSSNETVAIDECYPTELKSVCRQSYEAQERPCR